ncbi:MAG TPA: DUF1801 domain-containing protein [Agriterribacter sp.]|nr:DUF1801 domain-containing protein [Agriterribacter sp.]
MPFTDKRINVYILNAEGFAQPILNHLRSLVHASCPDVVETIKWGFPHFLYNGAILCSMAAFKKHCAFTFWKASLMTDKHHIFKQHEKTAIGHFGRIEKLTDLPSDKIMLSYLKEAVKLNKEKTKLASAPKPAQSKPDAPEYLLKTITKNKQALIAYSKLSPSHKKEYIEWITDAKTEPTRDKRINTMLQWLEEGKSRNWKHMKS